MVTKITIRATSQPPKLAHDKERLPPHDRQSRQVGLDPAAGTERETHAEEQAQRSVATFHEGILSLHGRGRRSLVA